MSLVLALPNQEQLPPKVSEAFDAIMATIQTWAAAVPQQAQWQSLTISGSNFTVDTGTWTVTPSLAQITYKIDGTTMVVCFSIAKAATTGSPGILFILLPITGYLPKGRLNTANLLEGRLVCETAQCLIWRDIDTYVPGTVAVLQGLNQIKLMIIPTAEGVIPTTAQAGAYGQIQFEVKQVV